MRRKNDPRFRFDAIVSEFREAMADLRHAPSTPPVMLRVYSAMGSLYRQEHNHLQASRRYLQGMRRHAGPEQLEHILGSIFHQFGIKFGQIGIHETASHDFTFILQQARTSRSRARIRRLASQLESIMSPSR